MSVICDVNKRATDFTIRSQTMSKRPLLLVESSRSAAGGTGVIHA